MSDRAPSDPTKPEPPGRLSARIAARVGHDLNNALAIFSGHVFLLRDGAEPLEEGLEAMEKAAANVERLARSLTSLGTLGLDAPADVDVNDVVRSVVASYPAGSIETRLDSAEQTLSARRADLEKALKALLDNAREACRETPGAGVTVTTAVEPAGVAIAVEDSGPGVPAEIRKRGFDPLFSTKGERGRGIGITLAVIASTIAGGSLEIEDRPAGGTRAVLRLPKTK